MAHSYYLLNCKGKHCGECETSCKLDESMYCSPDCEELDPSTDEPKGNENCQGCDWWHDFAESEGWELERHV